MAIPTSQRTAGPSQGPAGDPSPRRILLTPDEEPNRFMSATDLEDERYRELEGELDRIVRREILAGADESGGAPYVNHLEARAVLHGPLWWRWSLPWMILNGQLRAGLLVTDFAGGGSPLLAYIARERLCRCTGLDVTLVNVDRGGSCDSPTFKVDPAKIFPQVDWRIFETRVGRDGTMHGIGSGLAEASQDRVMWGGVGGRARLLTEVGFATSSDEEDVLAGVREAARVLKPGGLLLMTMVMRRGERRGGGGMEGGCDGGSGLLRAPAVIAMARREGLSVDGECDWIPPGLPPRPGMDLLGLVLRKS